MLTRYQYTIVNIGTYFAADRLGMTLAYFGQRGWDLVAVYDKESNWASSGEKGFVLLKRPVAAGAEPEGGSWAQFWSTDQVVQAYKEQKAS